MVPLNLLVRILTLEDIVQRKKNPVPVVLRKTVLLRKQMKLAGIVPKQFVSLLNCLLIFWKFAERMASKVILMVVKQEQEILPYEKLYGVKPSMDLICVFGCYAFAHVSVDS